MSAEQQLTVADAIADELARAGVDRVFGLPGGEVTFLMDALRRRGVEFVLCRHESNAGMMAAVYGKLKGTVGVVLTTLGPGAANLMLPLSNSWLDREPLLAISADLPASVPQNHTHQRLPLHEVYGPVTKHVEAVTALNARSAVRRALAASGREPLGPTYLTLAADDSRLIAAEPAPAANESTADAPVIGDPKAAAERIRELVGSSKRPLVLVGLGMRTELATELREWLDGWGLPVAVTPKIKGIVDETKDNFVGVVGGMAIDSMMVEALEQSDLLLGVGFDPVELDKLWHNTLPLHYVLDAPLAAGVVPRSNLIMADLGAVFAELIEGAVPTGWEDAFAAVRERRQAFYQGAEQEGESIAPTAIVRALASVLPAETIVTTDVGSHKYLFGQFWPSQKPATFFMSNGLSGMGYGLPAAMGAKLAQPDVPVVSVQGDGGFSMVSQELETAQRVGAPVISVVIADRSLSLIRISQANRGLPNYGVDFGPIDSVLAAQSCGVEGVRAETEEEIAAAAKRAWESNQSIVIEVPLDIATYKAII